MWCFGSKGLEADVGASFPTSVLNGSSTVGDFHFHFRQNFSSQDTELFYLLKVNYIVQLSKPKDRVYDESVEIGTSHIFFICINMQVIF